MKFQFGRLKSFLTLQVCGWDSGSQHAAQGGKQFSIDQNREDKKIFHDLIEGVCVLALLTWLPSRKSILIIKIIRIKLMNIQIWILTKQLETFRMCSRQVVRQGLEYCYLYFSVATAILQQPMSVHLFVSLFIHLSGIKTPKQLKINLSTLPTTTQHHIQHHTQHHTKHQSLHPKQHHTHHHTQHHTNQYTQHHSQIHTHHLPYNHASGVTFKFFQLVYL